MTPGTALAHGIYAVRVHFNGEHHGGAAYLGTRPTFDDGAPLLEVFLLDFDGNLYGRQIEVEFIDFIRGDRRFDGMEALIAQMGSTAPAARNILRQPRGAAAKSGMSGAWLQTAAQIGEGRRPRRAATRFAPPSRAAASRGRQGAGRPNSPTRVARPSQSAVGPGRPLPQHPA